VRYHFIKGTLAMKEKVSHLITRDCFPKDFELFASMDQKLRSGVTRLIGIIDSGQQEMVGLFLQW
jgi:hypothetical protein